MWSKVFLYIIVVLFSLNSYSQKEGWLTGFPDVFEKSIKENKPIMANFTGSDWCGWCIRLKKEVFSKDEFKDWAEENVVLLEADFPRGKPTLGDAKEIKKRLGGDVRGYPTILFLDAEGKVKGKSGYMKGGPGSWVKNAEKFTGS
mgnify:CR=1 FL=1